MPSFFRAFSEALIKSVALSVPFKRKKTGLFSNTKPERMHEKKLFNAQHLQQICDIFFIWQQIGGKHFKNSVNGLIPKN